MGSLITTLLSGGIEGAGKGIAAVIDSVRGKSPEDAAKLAEISANLESLQIKYAGDFALAQMNENISLNQQAGANIQNEEKQNAYAADARPSVIYAGLVIGLLNYGVLSLVPPWWGYRPINIPDIAWEVWGTCVMGYVLARSGDKLFGGSGGSLQLPFGVKADSKGDK